jgi:histone-lysine N-methyltransferase SETMAR
MNIWMDRIESNRTEQRVMVKYFVLKGYESKLIRKEFVNTFHNNAISLSIVKNWLRRFKCGDLSCSHEEQPERRLISLGLALQRFLKKFPFANARVMARNFLVDRATIKRILDQELGLRKFTRRWVPHILSVEQKLRKVMESQSLMTILANLADKNVQGVMSGDELWFSYLIESDAMFISCPAEMIPTVGPSISRRKVVITLFFTANGRLILDTLPKESKDNEHHFIDNLFPVLNQVRTGNPSLKVTPTLMVHTDNSICPNGSEITEKMSLKGSGQVPHPAYSPDISPCDFWAFETIKGMIKDRHIQSPKEILRVIQEVCSYFTFENF